jgi:maleate cis-trans isomerase
VCIVRTNLNRSKVVEAAIKTGTFRIEVVHASDLTPAIKVPRPNLGSDVNPAELYEWVRKHAPSNLEGVFIAGNGVIGALEEDLGLPVHTANQVAFWYALRLAGVGAQVDDYGQVFKKSSKVRK